MNRQEFTKIMAFLTAAVEKHPSRETVEVYYSMLKDMPYELGMAAAKKVIAEDEYPTLPTIGKIRRAASDLCSLDRITAGEAWGLVVKAIRRHGYYGTTQAMQELPEEVRVTVEQIGWTEICHSDKQDVMRAQFMRMYEAQESRRRELAMLPEEVKKMLPGIGKHLLEAGKEGSA